MSENKWNPDDWYKGATVASIIFENNKLQQENARLRSLVEKLQSFFGIERDMYYRDLDGEIYPFDLTEIEKALEKSE